MLRRIAPLVPLVVLAIAAPLAAQCPSLWTAGVWQAGEGFPGTAGTVSVALPWDRDGAGPAAPVLVVGGSFVFAGNERVNRVATFDPATGAWAPLALGVDNGVAALAVLPNGDLVVGGAFGGAFGTLSPGVVRWNGSTWSSLGGGVSLACYALLVLPNGDLIAAGTFDTAGGVPTNHIARWNGTAWSPLGSGLGGPFPVAQALARLPNGDVVVAGDFTSAGGAPADRIARWDGSAWSAMPGLPAGRVTRLATLPNGDLVASPQELGIQGSSLWRWTGSGWVSFAALGGSYSRVTSLDTSGGELVVGGSFTAVAGTPATHLARWDGAAWHAVGTAANPEYPNTAVRGPGGDLFVGGSFPALGSLMARDIARWTGTQWQALGGGVGKPVNSMAELPDGRLVVSTGELVLRRDGAQWTVLGGPFRDPVAALAVLPNGDLVVGGPFYFAGGGIAYTGLLRWDGAAWVPFGGQLTDLGNGLPYVRSLLVLPDGSLVAGGKFTAAGGVPANNVAVWNGTAWAPLGGGVVGIGLGNGALVSALLRLPGGDLVAGGAFHSAGGVAARNVARWDGSAWHAYGAGIPGNVGPLGLTADGQLVVGGIFVIGSPGQGLVNIVRWDGANWARLGFGTNGPVGGLALLPNGDLAVAGGFQAPESGLARFRDGAWYPLGGGISTSSSFPGLWVGALRMLRSGVLAVGGTFETTGGNANHNLAFLASTCPASVAPSGSGCAGSGGTLALAVRDLPWTGSTMRTVATGLSPGSLLVRVLGLVPASLPLASLHPAGGAGCTLLVDPLVLEAIAPPHAASVTTELAVPDDPALVGFVLREQIVEIEVDGNGAFVRLNASNALTATVGQF